jgi:hypothetical protein
MKLDEFVSDGIAKIQGSELLDARYKALTHAKGNAVMQAICTIIPTKQFANDYLMLKDMITPGLGNYILSFSILSEEREDDILFIKILSKVNLTLLRTKLVNTAQSSKKGTKEQISFKIMVIIPETHIHVEKRKIPDPAAETEIIRQLIERKFRVVDQSQVAIIRDTDQVRKSLQGDDKAAIAIGFDYGADIVVLGEAFSEYQQDLPNGLVSCSARVEARAIRTDTGEIITAHAMHANAADSTELLAGKKALASAGNKLAEYFAQKFQSIHADSVILQMVISPVNYEQFRDISSALEEMPNVTGVKRGSLDQGLAKVDVRFQGSIDEFGNSISALEFNNFKLNIVGFSENKVEIEIEQKNDGGTR